MPPWVLKAALQGMTSLLPGAERVNRLFQRYLTGSLELAEETLLTKYARCRGHLASYAVHGGGARNPTVMELGTGWFPIAPIGFALAGAEEVYAVDVVSHLARRQVIDVLRTFAAVGRRGALEGVVPERLARLEEVAASPEGDADDLLARVGVRNVIADARTLTLPGKVDLIVSNNTLEHIPYEVMHDIFVRLGELAAGGGVMSHFIDMSDHYMNFDRSIGPYNFLKFSEPVWRLFNNKHQYQNRLRLPDFRRLHAVTGWRIVEERNTAGSPEALRHLRLARRFRRYREEDLLVYESWMVSRRAA